MSDTNPQEQKLAAALYLVTGFFGDQEPLKWRLRGLANDLVCSVKDKMTLEREGAALLGLARSANLVSEDNYAILAAQFEKIQRGSHNSLISLLEKPEPAPVPPPALPRPAPFEARPVKDNLPESRQKERPTLREFGAVSVKKNSRQSIIIALLKRKKEVMIKDVVPLIAGCSEKTIQRELSDMVSAGILRRIGEKRWTRYTLA